MLVEDVRVNLGTFELANRKRFALFLIRQADRAELGMDSERA